MDKEDIKQLVKIVGRDGAIIALEKSSKITMKDLNDLAKKLDLPAGKKQSKKTLANKIVRLVDKRIEKKIDDLKSMSKDELIKYFSDVECDQEELLELLETIDLKAKAKSKRALIEYASIQIQSLGVFERLSHND